jgi:hypothetical protein
MRTIEGLLGVLDWIAAVRPGLYADGARLLGSVFSLFPGAGRGH